MTRISKKIIGWLLGVVAFVALALGIVFTRPQTKTVSADEVSVTWEDSQVSVENDGNYQRLRVNTSGLHWTSYNNQSYADNYLAYTKLNGRTVKEINAAATAAGETSQIHACLQPAGSFSFYSVYIPNDFKELLVEDVYSFSVEPGWSHLDSSTHPTYPGTGNTYTVSSTMRYNKREGSAWRMNTAGYTNIATGSTFGVTNQGTTNGSTCYLLYTKNTLWSNTSTLKLNDPILNNIYINGKSIDDWNEEAQAEVAAGTATDMLYGSTHGQNSNAGAPIAVLPGHGAEVGSFFQIYVSEGFLPTSEVYTIEWKENFEYMAAGTRATYYMPETVRLDSLGSSWRAITEFVDLDGGDVLASDQGAGEYAGVNCFLIRFGAQANIASYMCLNDNYAKASPLTGLTYGENLDHITINGKTIGEIKAENPDYDYSTSAHGNIKNGGMYSPIFAHMGSADLGRGKENYIQIYIPTDLIDPSTVTEIGLDERIFNLNGTVKYGLTEDITFVKKNGSWVDTRNMVSSENTTISEAYESGTAGELYMVDITSSAWNSTRDPYDYNYPGYLAVRQNLFINGVSVHTINTTVDDSAYVYSTSPMDNTTTWEYGGKTYDTFKNPVLLYAQGNLLRLWIHKDYMETLKGEVTLTVGENFNYLGTVMKEPLSKVIVTMEAAETVNNTAVNNVVYGDGLYLSFALSNADYPTKFTAVGAGYSEYDFLDKITLTLTDATEIPLRTAVQGDWQYYYYLGTANTIAMKLTGGYRTTGATPPVQITIPAGTQFPSYKYTNESGVKDVYETTEEVVFKSNDNGVTWYNSSSQYTVTFLDGDGNVFETQKITAGEKATAPAGTPTKTSTFEYKYTFNGWYVGETAFDFENTAIFANTTITAKFLEEDNTIEVETSILSAEWGLNSNNFLSFVLGTHDYTGVATPTSISGGDVMLKATNLLDKMYFDSQPAREVLGSQNTNPHFNIWKEGSFGFRVGTAGEDFPYERITIRAGCQFLSNAYVQGTSKTVYVTTEELVFVNMYGSLVEQNSIPPIENVELIRLTYGESENWLVFTFDDVNYPTASDAAKNLEISTAGLNEFRFFNFIEVTGQIHLNHYESGTITGVDVVETATLSEIYAHNGMPTTALVNIWMQQNTFAIRITEDHQGGFSTVTSIRVKAGTEFPSYQSELRYLVASEVGFEKDAEETVFTCTTQTSSGIDMWMSQGASVRIAGAENYDSNNQDYFNQEGYKLSGIRFQTNISKAAVAELESKLENGTYTSVTFGTLIVPSQDLMGGQFTHDWLNKNGKTFIDLESSAGIGKGWAKETDEYVSYFGSIVKLKTTNHARNFAGLGYVLVEKEDGTSEYFYAPYETSYARSAAYIAQMAIADRAASETDEYKYQVSENNNWSPYTDNERAFLALYLSTLDESKIPVRNISSELAELGGTATLDMTQNGLAQQIGSYIHLTYSTNINILGTLVYSSTADATTTVSEEFYLQAGSGEHKQYLDLFRTNGLGYYQGTPGNYSSTRLIDPNSVYLKEIIFKNAELKSGVTPQVQLVGFRSTYKTLDTSDLPENSVHLYLTREQTEDKKNPSEYQEVTIGVNLALGGAFTYLAKSGVYEGITSTASKAWFSSTYSKGNVGMSLDPSKLQNEDPLANNEIIVLGSSGEGSSRPGVGVNLINNYDPGRQIQQSYYAAVGGSDETTDGSNGYTRAYCYTESSDGKYWPYNPVQAGDCGNNTSQIIDYELNTDKNYIYIKARAMDWAQGIDDRLGSGQTQTNAIEGGRTTKSYMENYYYLNADGTVKVDNSFVDWNGFTDMEACEFQSNELPATILSHNLAYYVSNTSSNTSDAWTGDLTYVQRPDSYLQSDVNGANHNGRKYENWYAWSIDAQGSFALGMYIPNVTNFSSNVITSSDSLTTDRNAYANVKGHSRACPIWTGTDGKMLYDYADIRAGWESCYVFNDSYTAPSTAYRMEEYKTMQYSYVISVNDVTTIRSQFKEIYDSGALTNGGKIGEKVGLDAWARMDKAWTW